MAQRTYRNPNRIRWFALAIMLLGFAVMIVDFQQRSHEQGASFFRVHGVWGIVGLSLVGIALFWWLVAYFTTRCPFCGKWIAPRYYPRRGVHCPQCGKTAGT